MGQAVCMGAQCKCSFGVAPTVLTVAPANKVMTMQGAMAVATIMDNKPMANILPFGMCQASSNPMVAAATAAALGAFTPMPCIPVITAPWVPGSPTVLVGNFPALNKDSKLMCQWGGVIEILNPGQTTVEVP